jgi:hypothetical protein
LNPQGGENEKASARLPPISFEVAQTGGYRYRYRQTAKRGAQKGGQQVLYYLLYQYTGTNTDATGGGAQRSGEAPLDSAIRDFLARLVKIHGAASEKVPEDVDAEGLDVLVRGVGMTVGCMEMLSRDPCAEVLTLLALLVQKVLRLLALLVQK